MGESRFLGYRYRSSFLGVIAIGVSKSSGVYELAKRINQTYAMVFTILLYLVIGPFFALPRLATTSFEIGLAPFIDPSRQTLYLAIFSIVFFCWLGGFQENRQRY